MTDRQTDAVDDYIEKLTAERDELRDWVRYEAQHAPGCSGWDDRYRCKCGLRELKQKIEGESTPLSSEQTGEVT